MKKPFKTFKDSKAFAAAAVMPPLVHYPNRDQPFDIRKSEAVKWAIEQPEILQYLFNKLTESEAIVFRNGKWVGYKND